MSVASVNWLVCHVNHVIAVTEVLNCFVAMCLWNYCVWAGKRKVPGSIPAGSPNYQSRVPSIVL